MHSARTGMKIRGQRKAPSNPKDFETHWAVLSSAFIQIHDQDESGLSYEQLYRASYQIVLSKQAGRLYDKLLEFESEWLKNQVQTHVARNATQVAASTISGSASSSEFSEKLMLQIVTLWENYKLSITLISDVLLYLDRAYCYREQTYIGDACVQYFRDLIIFGELGLTPETELSSVIKDVIFQQLNAERSGFAINRPVLSSLIKMLNYLPSPEGESVYQVDFYQPIIDASRQFFKIQAAELARNSNPAQYFRAVKRILTEDYDRCRSVLTDETAIAIQKVLDDEMLGAHFESLLYAPNGLRLLFNEGAVEDLSIIYSLNLRISDKAVQIANVARALVGQIGTELNESTLKSLEPPEPGSKPVTDPKAAPDRTMNRQTAAALKWAEGLLEMKVKFDTIWQKAFQSSHFLQAEITNGFMDFINNSTFNRAPEYISLFIDSHLRKQAREIDSSQFGAVLNQIITLVQFVSSKDAIEMYYKKHLSKRLLMTKAGNITFEKQVLGRLKQEWGSNATTRLETMFRDIDISQQLTDSYKVAVSPTNASVQLQLNVLNSAAWPADMFQKDARANCVLPPEILEVQKSFENYYNERHAGRVLNWQDGLGTVDLRATFSSVPISGGGTRERKHELNVSVHAMAILMLFNDIPVNGSLSFTEIREKTKITDQDLIRNLQSLAIVPKTRVLLKVPMSREINPATDRFKFNDAFQSQYYKVKIGVLVGNKAESEKEKKGSDKQLITDRLYGIQAVVVRIMKQHKTMRQTDLVNECIQQIRTSFVPDIPLIKKGIEKTIEREFLDVVTENGEVICNYVA